MKTFRTSSHKSIAQDKAVHECKPQAWTKEDEEASPSCMSQELQEKWRSWAESFKRKGRAKGSDDGCTAIRHWKAIFEIFNPGKEIPDPRKCSLAKDYPL
jgi:hypothetical protein